MPTPTPSRSSGLPYWPAIDGLRAVAVLGVLLFHSGYSWAEGGYLGVSTFFTLSGFLITGLLLSERERTGRIDAGHFWSRRFRRLLPAALVALGLAVLFGATIATPDQVRELRGDIIACLTYVANWRFYFGDQSYADLFTAPSPVLHFWSLAIEEQFYLLFPLVAIGLLALGHGSRRFFGIAVSLLIAGSLSLALFFGFSHDRIYYGTDTRAAELLLGSLLAVVVTGRSLPRTAQRVARVASPIALLFCVWAMATLAQGTDALYHGGFVVYGVATMVIVLGAIQTRGPTVMLLSVPALVLLGRISYGVYLYHWLVYQWLTPSRTGLEGSGVEDLALLALRLGVTFALAGASYVFVEQPIRRGNAARGRTPYVAVPAAIGALTVAVLLVTVSVPPPLIDFAAAEEALSSAPIDPFVAGPPVTVDPTAELPVPPAPRIAMFGDSTALMTGAGLTAWMDRSGLASSGGGNSWLGCGVGRGGERRTAPTVEEEIPANCDDWANTWVDALDEGRPDLAVIGVGPWEVTDRKLEGDDTWRAPGDPVYDDFLRSEMLAATDLLSSQGAEVVWLTSPPVGPGVSGDEIEIRGDAADPARMARLNQLMAEVVAQRADVAHVVDLAGYVASTGDDVRLRPDGVHFSDTTSVEVATNWLGPELVALHRTEWIAEWVEENGPPVPEPVRVLSVGDSTAMMVSFGLNQYTYKSSSITLSSLAELGCGLAVDGDRDYQGEQGPVPPRCRERWDEWEAALAAFDPDVVTILTGPFDVADHRLPDDDTWRHPGDPVYDDYLREKYRAATDLLSSQGALVVWLSSPHIDLGRGLDSTPDGGWPASEPARIDRLNEIIDEIVEDDPDADLADYAGHLATYPGGEMDATIRPDGVHVANEQTHLIGDWLGPELVEVYGRWTTEQWIADATADLRTP